MSYHKRKDARHIKRVITLPPSVDKRAHEEADRIFTTFSALVTAALIRWLTEGERT